MDDGGAPFSLPVLSGLVTIVELVIVGADEDGDDPRQLPSLASGVALAEEPAPALFRKPEPWPLGSTFP